MPLEGQENEGQQAASAENSAATGEGSSGALGGQAADAGAAAGQGAGENSAASAQADPNAAQVDPAAVAAAAAAFKPNYKVKVMDEEKEIPEAFRALMKDEKSEKEIKEIFEKSFGHEFTKPKYEKLKSEYTEVQQTHTAVMNQINSLKEDFARGDLDSFFDKLKIPTDTILRYALEKVQYQELPPEQKAVLDAKRQAEREAKSFAQQNQELTQNLQVQMVQARTMALDSELARSEVKSVADAFDARTGEKGAFKKLVANHGRLTWFDSQGKVDLSPGQAIEQVMKLYGLSPAPASAQAPTTPAAAASTHQAPTAIPNVGGSKSASPVKQKPRSIEDLKKLAAEM